VFIKIYLFISLFICFQFRIVVRPGSCAYSPDMAAANSTRNCTDVLRRKEEERIKKIQRQKLRDLGNTEERKGSKKKRKNSAKK